MREREKMEGGKGVGGRQPYENRPSDIDSEFTPHSHLYH